MGTLALVMVLFRMVFMAALGRILTYVLVRWDVGRLDQDARDRAWNEATRGSAIWLIGPACVFGWGFVTRAWWKGLLLGALWFVGIALSTHVLDITMASLFGWPLDLEEAMFGK